MSELSIKTKFNELDYVKNLTETFHKAKSTDDKMKIIKSVSDDLETYLNTIKKSIEKIITKVIIKAQTDPGITDYPAYHQIMQAHYPRIMQFFETALSESEKHGGFSKDENSYYSLVSRGLTLSIGLKLYDHELSMIDVFT